MEDPTIASILARMEYPEHPVPLGVLRAFERPSYDALMEDQVKSAIAAQGEGDLATLLSEGDTWVVE